MVSEIRTVAADDLWLSPAYDRDVTALHFTWTQSRSVLDELIPLVEATLAPFGPMPHWGKISTLPLNEFVHRLPRFREAASIRQELDPGRKFINEFWGAFF
jgi:alditol oxidase